MLIQHIDIQNFRSHKDTSIDCSSLTVLVGRNGAGKSSVMYALDVFYDPGSNISAEDFFNRDTENDILIRVTYSQLNRHELEEFKTYIQDQQLIVVKKISYTDTGFKQRYFAAAQQIPEFARLRALSKSERRSQWKELVDSGKLPGLSGTARSADIVDTLMNEYESDHRELLKPVEREEQFFGPKNVGGGKLDKFTRYVHIPAVREAANEMERKGVIYELIDTIVVRKINAREDVQALRQEFEERVSSVYSPDNLTELGELASSVSEVLKQYAPGAELRLHWGDPKVPDIPPPPAYARLLDDGYDAPISHTGHGLQRALILSLLQHLATLDTGPLIKDDDSTVVADSPSISPDLILAIEEPELYLHPSRCRYLADLLLQISMPAENRSPQNQVLYATHSPYFVDLHRFDQVRLARRVKKDANKPPCCTLTQYSLEEASKVLAKISNKDASAFTRDSFRARSLPVFNAIVNEGFFSDAVLVVEGLGDVGVFFKLQQILGKRWQELGIVIVPASGKENVDRPVVIFRGLEIPCYFVFDGDSSCDDRSKKQTQSRNRRYLRLAGVNDEDFPLTRVESTWAVFNDEIETEIQAAVGEQSFLELRKEAADALGYASHKQLLKNIEGASVLVENIYHAGKRLPILEDIVMKVTELRLQST